MKVTITARTFAAALAPVARVAPSKSQIPILSHVLVEATGQGLALIANDLDREAEGFARATVAREGAACFPAATLLDILKKLPGEEMVAIDLEPADANGRATLRCGRARFLLPTLPAVDFPRMAAVDFTHRFALPAKTVLRAFGAVAWAISTEETRYYLNGVYLHPIVEDGFALRFVTTDGHRLARLSLPLPHGAAGFPQIIAPTGAVKEALRRAGEAGEDAEVRIAVSPTLLRFEIGETALTTKLIDGTFPDYARVIPRDAARTAKVSRDALKGAIDLAMPLANAKSHAMRFTFGGGRIAILSRGEDTGEATTEAAADDDGEAIDVGFNARYALEALAAFDGETVSIALNDPMSPAVLTDPDDETLLVVLMPCRA